MADFDFAKAAGQLAGAPTTPDAAPAAPLDFAKAAGELAMPVSTTPKPNFVDDSSRTAGAGTIAAASFANDPQAQIRYYARQRGIPETRYQMIGDRIAYQGDDGNFYPEVPSGWTPGDLLGRAAQGVGSMLPVGAGTAAGILTAPALLTGPPGLAVSVGATGASAAAGQALREMIADIWMDQPKSGLRVVKEGLTAATGQGIGAGLSAWQQRYAVPEAGRFSQADVNQNVAAANRQGIDITPAEATNFPSLKAQQKWLGNTVQSQNEMAGFYEKRTGQVQGATDRFLGKISPVDSAEVAGDMGQKAAARAVVSTMEDRAAKASPLYKKAWATEPLPWSDELETLMSRPSMKEAWSRAQKIAAERDITLPQVFMADKDGNLTLNTKTVPDWQTLHFMKLGLDDLVSSAESRGNSFGNVVAGSIKQTTKNLTGYMKSNNQSYAEAQKMYADTVPGVERITEGMVGRMADAGPMQLSNMARTLFGANSGPAAIAEAKAAISKADPEAWQALKRSWIQDIFEKSQTQYASAYGGEPNIAGKFFAGTRGSLQTFARMKAALDPSEMQAFTDLTDVLRMASRVKPIGSDTEFNRLITEAERTAARPVLAKIAANINPADALRNLDTWLTSRNMAANAEDMTNIIVNFSKNPDLLASVKELKKLSPTSVQFRVGLGHLLSQGAVAGASAALTPDQ